MMINYAHNYEKEYQALNDNERSLKSHPKRLQSVEVDEILFGDYLI